MDATERDVVRIYRRSARDLERIHGTVEIVATGEERAFQDRDGLLTILFPVAAPATRLLPKLKAIQEETSHESHRPTRTMMTGFLIVLAGHAMAGDPVRCSGSAIDKAEKMETVHSNPATGRLIFSSVGRGKAREALCAETMDGAQRMVRANWDLVNGTGPGHGFSSITAKNGDSYSAQ